MRILILSDIHANLTALQSVLDDAGNFEATWCLGDLVGYGPEPNECVELISNLPNLTCIMGNHDSAVLDQIDLSSFNREARQSVEWTKSMLTEKTQAFLRKLPEKVVIEDQATLVHGSPRAPVWEYLLDTYNAFENFDFFDTRLCFVGHTHIPVAFYLREENQFAEWQILHPGDHASQASRMIINPGSTGQPRDHDPRAAYMIFESKTADWVSCRVAYDTDEVGDKIRNAGLPERHAIRIASGW